MSDNFDMRRRARELAARQRTELEMKRGREKVEENRNKHALSLAKFYLAKEFDPDFVPSAAPTEGIPGDFVSDYNRALWERNKNREDFK